MRFTVNFTIKFINFIVIKILFNFEFLNCFFLNLLAYNNIFHQMIISNAKLIFTYYYANAFGKYTQILKN